MAQSPTERMTAIERIIDVHAFRLDAWSKEVDALRRSQVESANQLVVLHRDFDREVALLKREVEELKKWRDDVKKGEEKCGRKLWMIRPPRPGGLRQQRTRLRNRLYVKK